MEPDEQQAIPTDDNAGESWSPPAQDQQPQQGIPDTQSPEQVYGPGPTNNPIASAGAAVGQGLSNLANAGKDMQQQPAQNPNPDEQPGGKPFPGTEMITSLLMGKGAADPQQAQELVDHIKAHGANDDEANMLAVVQAGKAGGPQAEWAMVQYNRVAFNAKQSFASAALQGVQGKAPDINAAATAATQASAHILDGTSSSFHVDGNGVTATVTDPKGQKSSYDMTAAQFGQYLDLSKTSQYDRLMQTGGVAGAMQQVGAKPTSVGNADAGGKDQEQAPQGGESGKGDLDVDAAKKGIAQGQSDQADATQKKKDDAEYQASEQRLLEEGNKRFPWASQGAQRDAWMAQQRNFRESNEATVEAAGERGKNAVARAKIMAGGRVQAADVTGTHRENIATGNQANQKTALQIKQDRLNMDIASRQNNEQGRTLRSLLARNPDLTLDDANTQLQNAKLPSIAGSTVAPTVRGNPAQGGDTQDQSGDAAQAAQGKKFFNGQWYTKDEYQRHLTGQD